MTSEERASIDNLHRTLGQIETPKVLIVEDDPNDVQLHCAVLNKFECSVLVAKSGEEAISLIMSDGIDLILLDAKLPQQPAEDVIAVASGLMPNASVVMVTGYPDSITKSLAIKKGAKLILPKPLTEETLSAILHRKSGIASPC